MTEVIEHVAHPDSFLKRVAQFLRPGGHIVLTTPNGEYFRNRLPKFSECTDPSRLEPLQFKPDADGHLFLLYLDEIRKFAIDAGLSVGELRVFNNALTSGALGTKPLLRVFPQRLIQGIERITSSLPTRLAKRWHLGMAALLRKSGGRPSVI